MAHIVVVVCDRCLAAGDEVKATEEFSVAFDGKKPRQLALCGEHYKPYADLREFAESDGVMVRDGAPVSHRSPRPRDATCSECGKTFTAGGLASHVRMAHRQADHLCPECGRSLSTPQGLALHRQVKHGAKKRGE